MIHKRPLALFFVLTAVTGAIALLSSRFRERRPEYVKFYVCPKPSTTLDATSEHTTRSELKELLFEENIFVLLLSDIDGRRSVINRYRWLHDKKEIGIDHDVSPERPQHIGSEVILKKSEMAGDVILRIFRKNSAGLFDHIEPESRFFWSNIRSTPEFDLYVISLGRQ